MINSNICACLLLVRISDVQFQHNQNSILCHSFVMAVAPAYAISSSKILCSSSCPIKSWEKFWWHWKIPPKSPKPETISTMIQIEQYCFNLLQMNLMKQLISPWAASQREELSCLMLTSYQTVRLDKQKNCKTAWHFNASRTWNSTGFG